MTAKSIVQSVSSMFKDFWKRHQKNLGLMVAGIAQCGRVGVAAIGRAIPVQTTPKHAIKRVDGFLSNPRFDHHKAQEELLRTVIGPRKYILIAIDWTKIRQWPALVAGVVQRGRAIPVMWSVMDRTMIYKSFNAFENGFFSWMSRVLPPGVKAVVLLDRGFKRVELVKHLRRCGLSFVIRTGGNTHVRHEQYRGRVDRLIKHRGEVKDLRQAILRPSRPVEVRVVGKREKGQKEPWLLMTDLTTSVEQVMATYGKRFRIEETFRDEKDARFGLFLGKLKMTQAERLEKLLLVVAIFHFLAMMVGGEARRQGYDRGFRANTVIIKPTHSDFTLGQYYIMRIRCSLLKLFRNFYAERVPLFVG